MEPKYYVPEYSDIYIGQDLYTIDGYKIDLSTIDSLTWFLTSNNCYMDGENNITYGISLENYRVKYLDTSDIEELGFVKTKYCSVPCYEKDCWRLYWFENNNMVSIEKFYKEEKEQYFRGWIKNKSELKKVLNMLNIK